MNKEMRKRLERFGRVETDFKTWVQPWETYWHLYCKRHHDLLVKVLARKYPDYDFSRGECRIRETIYQVIHIYKKES